MKQNMRKWTTIGRKGMACLLAVVMMMGLWMPVYATSDLEEPTQVQETTVPTESTEPADETTAPVEPEAAEPEVTEPEVTEPEATEPEVTEPAEEEADAPADVVPVVPEAEDTFEKPSDFKNVAMMSTTAKVIDLAALSAGNAVKKNDYLFTSKTVSFNGTDYVLRLESYLTGEDTVTTETRIPSDIVLVLDQSGSMDYCFECADDNADAVAYTVRNSGIMAGKASTAYYCKNDDGKAVRLYYCDSGDACKYVDSADAKKTHTPGWYTKDHTAEKTTSASSVYIPGPADSPKIRSRIFYKNKACTTPHYDTVNGAGETCYGKFSVEGIYYSDASGDRLYYCDTCKTWFTKEECNADNHKLSTARYPRANSEDENYGAFAFREQTRPHAVYGSDVKTSKSYWVNQEGRVYGEEFHKISYCKTCKAWHVKNQHDGVKYTPKASKDAETGTTFYGTCTGDRGDALRTAMESFLAAIYDDSTGKDGVLGTEDDVHNRIAVAGFSADDTDTNAVLSYAKSGATTATKKTYNEIYGNEENDPRGGTPNETLLKNTLQDVATTNGQSVIDSAVASLKKSGNTETFKGIRMAKDILDSNPLAKNEERNRIVVVFTDGEPVSKLEAGDDVYNTGTSYRFCDAAMEYAAEIKAKNIPVYGIGIFAGADASDILGSVSKAPRNNANKFMHLISSNFPKAKDADKAYGKADMNKNLKDGESYYLSASSTEALKEIFDSIAASVTGKQEAHIKGLDKTTQIRDVISSNFALAYGVDTTKVTVHTEAFTGTKNGVKTWKDDNKTAIDNQLKVTIDEASQLVTVTGFDFSKLYVATDTAADGTVTPRGRKIVVEIPIKPAEDNMGGLKQNTNVQSDSGVYDPKGQCVENFDDPYIDVPAKVTVEKLVTGNMGDRACDFDFKVEYKQFVKHGNVDLSGKYDSNYLNTATTKNVVDEFPLAHTETKFFDTIYCGSKIKVSELNVPAGYEVFYTVKYADGSSTAATKIANKSIELDVVPGMKITFTNRLDVPIDTGVVMDSLPYILILALVAAGAAVMFLRKRKVEG